MPKHYGSGQAKGRGKSTNIARQGRFSQIPSVNLPRSKFDRSHGHKTTFDSGKLVPIFVDEALPGDTMSLQMSTFTRLATLLHPVMDNMNMDVQFFAVPYRLVWDNFQKFMGEQENPGDSTSFLVPQVQGPVAGAGGWAEGSLADYFGIPTLIGTQLSNALHFRAYNLIWNEWYRDENLQVSLNVPKDDGPDAFAQYVVARRGKRHDYFTSCLPFPQKGTAITLPLGTSAPIVGGPIPIDPLTGTIFPTWSDADATGFRLQRDGAIGSSSPNIAADTAAGNTLRQIDWEVPGLEGDTSGLTADLTNATAATINQIRESFQIQRLFERDARGGTRYTEILNSHFGVQTPDQRLQRPEYLGGGSTRVMVTPVAQTSETTGAAPLGELGAYGIAADTFRGWTKSFVEHCVIIGLVSIRADLNYQYGQHRMWDRQTRFDFYWPSLAHLGEQAVLQGEIYADGTPNDDIVFGYQERFAEYRYKPSLITGAFRSQHSPSLDTWHLAIDFASAPLLNSAFIEENPPTQRIVAVIDEPEWLFDAFFKYTCVRPMPTYSVPGLIDHF